MKQITLILLLILSIKGFSQENYNSESYQVTSGDIKSKTYIKDSTANALVIYETGKSYVHKTEFDLRTEEKHKIKILNREGFDNATVKIYLYNSKSKSEKVEKITAITYNKVGDKITTTKLNKENIFTEKYNENYTLIKFTLPNIQEGSVISYSYTTVSPFMFKYHGWEFQSDIPKLFSEYKTSIPGYWIYHIKLIGSKEKLSTNTSDIERNCLNLSRGGSADCMNSVYVMKDVPAFIEEDYMTSRDNYLLRIDYELQTFRAPEGGATNYSKTWKDVDKEFKNDKEIGKQLRKPIDAEELLNPDILNEKDILKKAKAIYKYVQNDYTWNGDYNIFKDVSIKDLLKDKSGNVSSINILLHNLLLETEIMAKPVLVSTRNNGFPTKLYPVFSDFNYLIIQVKIKDKTYLLDATDKYLNFGEIPARCLNDQGRLLDFENGSSWVDLKPNNLSGVYYDVKLKFDENGKLSGTLKSKRTGYNALNKRKSYYENKSDYLETLENNYPNVEISNFEVISSGKTSKDFKEVYNVSYNFDIIGENIYLNPFFVKFFKENPFKLQERTYPIDFGYKDSYFYGFKIQLTDDYKVVELPKEQYIKLPNNTGQLVFGVKKVGNTLNLTFKIDFKESFYNPDYYPYLKEFMSKIVDIQTNSIILLKKSN